MFNGLKVYVIWFNEIDGMTHSNYFDYINFSFNGSITLGCNKGEGAIEMPTKNVTLIRPATVKEMEDDLADQTWELQHPS